MRVECGRSEDRGRIAAAKPSYGPSLSWGKGGEPIPYSKARVTRFLTDKEREKIRQLVKLGIRKCDLARRFHCGISTIKKILKGVAR
jgi:DNA invertase Pin-like site-specific DNA recombinase